MGSKNSASHPFGAVLLQDDNSAPSDRHTTRVRFIHTSPDAPAVDVLANGQPLLRQISYGQAVYASTQSGVYTFQLQGANVNLKIPSVSLAGGDVTTFVIQGFASSLFVKHFLDASYTYFTYRMGHASPDTHAVNVYFDGSYYTKLSYGNLTSYGSDKPAGTHNITLTDSDTGIFLYTQLVTFEGDHTYTLMAIGMAHDKFQIASYTDDFSAPSGPDVADVTFFQLAPSTSAIDIKIGEVNINNIEFSKFTKKSITAGTYVLQVFDAGTSNKICQIQVTFNGGQVYSAFFEGLSHSITTGYTFLITKDASFEYSSFLFSHASPNVPALDVFIDGKEIFNNVAYGTFTTTTYILSGTQNIVLYIHGSDIDPILTSPQTFAVNTDYTLFAIGELNLTVTNSFTLALIVNSPAASSQGKTYLRVFHASPDAPAVRVQANEQLLVPSLSYASASAYQLMPEGTYFIQVIAVGSFNRVAFLPSYTMTSGQVITIVILGSVQKNSLELASHTEQTFSYFGYRLAHTSPDVGAIDVYVNSIKMQSNFVFGKMTPYVNGLLTGAYNITITHTGASTILYQEMFNMDSGLFTFAAVGSVAMNSSHPFDLVSIQDNQNAPDDPMTARIKFVQTSPNTPAVDVKFNGQNVFTNVDYLGVSDYNTSPAGVYNISIFLAGTTDQILFVQNVHLSAGGIYTIFTAGLTGSNSPVPFTAVINEDKSYQYFNLRVAHIAPKDGPVDFYFMKKWPNYSFSSISDYVTVPVMNGVFWVYAHETDNIIASTSLSPSAGSFSTAALVGLSSSTQYGTYLNAVVFPDTITPPASSGQALIRAFHAVPNGPSFDIRFNNIDTFPNLFYLDSSSYSNMDEGTYRLQVFPSGSSHPIFTQDDIQLQGGKVYSLFLEGTLDSMSTLLTTDATYHYYTLRTIHAALNVPFPVDVILDGKKIWTGLTYQSQTHFQSIICPSSQVTTNGCNANVTVVSSTTSIPVIGPKMIEFSSQKASSLVVIGLYAQKVEPLVVVDDFVPPPAGTSASIRFVHASPNAGEVDIYSNGTALVKKFNFAGVSDYITVGAGVYDITLVQDDNVLLSVYVTLLPGNVYTVYVEGLKSGIGMNALHAQVVVDYIAPPTFYLRTIHAAPTTSTYDLVMDNQLAFTSVSYSQATDYSAFEEGTYTANFTYAGTFKSFYSTTLQFTDAKLKYYSLIAIGVQHPNITRNVTRPVHSILVEDDPNLPAEGSIKIRFIHLSPDAPALDLRDQDGDVFRNITYKESTEYFTKSAKIYSFSVFPNVGSEKGYVEGVDFDFSGGPSVYTIVAEGIVNARGDEPKFQLVWYRDSAHGPAPPSPSAPKQRLSAWQLGLIIAGSILAVLLISIIGFTVYKKNRAGYSSIPSTD